jgi:transcriptional regulator with XRE-family HTH domain
MKTKKGSPYNRIKLALVEKNKTNKALADHLGIGPVTVSRWCTNDSQPSIPTLFKIADFLDIKVKDLFVELR